jgi:hypothetical protein
MQLRVDQLQHRDPRLGVLRRDGVAERPQRALLGGVEEARRGWIDAREHDRARLLVPVACVLEHIEVRVAADHLRRRAAALARQARGPRRQPAGGALRQVGG